MEIKILGTVCTFRALASERRYIFNSPGISYAMRQLFYLNYGYKMYELRELIKHLYDINYEREFLVSGVALWQSFFFFFFQ